ncbi:MFS transporter [Pseudolabrys taiwanensis]|uniref:Bcr/CflA family efflux transporter n=1 Tax=Pseudolabrys taiwanensis TaxID=331696 RepID=A0A346A321_9HYPH|nr:multidrug effflux MFS transporter [Pseudolabrys taiwanensis]AXK83568.1 MFS transporter [Pseudolabrys taiwanensis]
MRNTKPSTSSSGATNWRLLALLMLMTGVGPATLNIVVPALPTLVKALATDTATVQLTLSLYLFSFATAQLVLGPLSDRFGRRPVILAALALNMLVSFAAIAASSIHMLIVARILQAIGASGGVVISRAIIRDLYDRDRAAGMIGLVTTAMVIAPMVAPLIGGLLDTAFGWEAIFVAIALLASTAVIWAYFTLPETRPAAAPQSPGLLIDEWRRLLRHPRFYGYVLIGAFGSAPFFVFLGGAPHVVITLMGRSSAEYGLWFAVMSFGYMSGNFTVSRLSQRFGVDALIVAGLVVELIGCVVTVALIATFKNATPALIFLPQLVVSYGNGLLMANSISGAISIRPQAAGSASGMAGFVQMSVGAASTQIVSFLLVGAATGLPMAWMAVAAISLGCVAYVALVRTPMRRE